MKFTALTVGICLLSSHVLGGQQSESQPTFQARTDVVRLDVSVTDSRRQPITGLTAADFTVLEDGQPRPIQSFVEVDVATPDLVPAGWARDVSSDVGTNERPPKRVVVIFIDDFSFLISEEASMLPVRNARNIARAVVDELGPDDAAAVIFSLDNRRVQTLTTDHARLVTAIEKTPLFTTSEGPDTVGLAKRGDCTCGLCSFDAVRDAARGLETIEGVRKSIVYIGPGMQVTLPPDLVCYPRQALALEDAFSAARAGHVTIHAFDPRGLRPEVGSISRRNAPMLDGPRTEHSDPRLEFLRNLAWTTGGRAVVNTNDPHLNVPDVMAEGRSYYLIGFAPASGGAAGRERKVDVRVSRRGADVRTRSRFVVPDVASAVAGAGPASSDRGRSVPALRALTSPLLPRADFPVRVQATPMATANGGAAVAMVLSMALPTQAGATLDRTDLIVRIAEQGGQDVAIFDQTIDLSRDAVPVGDGRYEFVRQFPIAPGRYELRVGVISGERSASVYTALDVPDFGRDRVALSGPILTAPSWAMPRASAAGEPPSVFPTTRREFRADEPVTAIVRAYRRPQGPVVSVSVAAEIRDASGRVVFSRATPLDTGGASAETALDYALDLPLAGLAEGEHLLTLTISAGEMVFERAVRFRIVAR